MIRINQLILSWILMGLSVAGYGQDRKEIRDLGIVSKTVQEYFIEDGIDEPLIESIEKYNEDGEMIEIQEFNSRGEVKLWEKYAYDEDRNLIEEIFLDHRGRITRIERSVYKDGLRVEKHYYNNKEKLYKKKVYVYEYSK